MLKNGVEIADRFSLTRRLGGSDEISVWEAVDRKSNARVVLKLQRATDAPSALEAEYRARSGLVHPGIAKPLELVRDTDFICVVTELAPAGDLGTLRGRPYGKFLGYLQQVAEALRYLHASGWVYGDLKPANVLIDSAGQAHSEAAVPP